MGRTKKMKSPKGARIASGTAQGLILRKETEIPNTILRWGEEVDRDKTLHPGKFIIEGEAYGNVRLADANWDYQGRVTFYSSKHGHVISRKDLGKFERVTVQV